MRNENSAKYNAAIAAAAKQLPEQWTWLKGYKTRFDKDYEAYRGPKDAIYKARSDAKMDGISVNDILQNPQTKEKLVKQLEKNGSKDGKALIDRYTNGWKTIQANSTMANKYRRELRAAGYTDGILQYASDDYKNIMQDTSMMLGTGFKFSPDAFRDKVGHYASGGMVVPKMFAAGGYASGTDTVPAMLTPGEFVVRKFAVDSFGADRLEAINAGIDPSAGGNSNTSIIGGDSLYNYNVSVNVRSDADPNAIARTVMEQIRRVDSQRIRSTRV
jgi:hypothetical protein